MGTEPLYLREGGSIPIIGIMSQLLGMDCLMLATLRLEVSPPPPYNRIRGIFNRRTSRGTMPG